MKKFMKFILWLVAICGAAIGAMYFIKNVLMKDYLDDYDVDFDNDLYDEDDEDDDREYVTINPADTSETSEEEESKEDAE